MSSEVSWTFMKIELLYIILYFVEKKFYNFNPLDCDTVRNVLPNSNFKHILRTLFGAFRSIGRNVKDSTKIGIIV